jgi:hypothetical protein
VAINHLREICWIEPARHFKLHEQDSPKGERWKLVKWDIQRGNISYLIKFERKMVEYRKKRSNHVGRKWRKWDQAREMKKVPPDDARERENAENN